MQADEILGRGRMVGVPTAPSSTTPVLMESNKAISGSSQKGSTYYNRSFAPKRHCPCAEEVVETWTQIDGMNEVGFDAIVAASEHAIDLWPKSQECQFCSPGVSETLLQIYGKLVDLLESAVVTYASFLPRLPATEASLAIGGNHSGPTVDRRQIRSSQQNGQQDIVMTGNLTSPSASNTACLPSAMLFGEYELDEQQSRHLALGLVCRKLKSLAAILHQMRLQGAGGINESGCTADATFSRVLRLLSAVAPAFSTSL